MIYPPSQPTLLSLSLSLSLLLCRWRHNRTPRAIPLLHLPRPKQPTRTARIRAQIHRRKTLATATAGRQTHAPRHGTVLKGRAVGQSRAAVRDVAESRAELIRLADAVLRAVAAGREAAHLHVAAGADGAADAALAFGGGGALCQSTVSACFLWRKGE
jgi:hypothetical protein